MLKKHTLIILFFSCILVCGCKKKNQEMHERILSEKNETAQLPDTLRVATMVSCTSYFSIHSEIYGLDYELAENLSEYIDRPLKIKRAKTEEELAKMVLEKKADIAVYPVVETKQLKASFEFVCPHTPSYMVLVQRLKSDKILSDVTELKGTDIHVPAKSVFYNRLKQLNSELGGGINIVAEPDTTSNDALIEKVEKGEIAYTVAYRNNAMLHKNYSDNLICRMQIGFNQRSGWLIRKDDQQLKKLVEEWQADDDTQLLMDEVNEQYYEKNPYFAFRSLNIPKGAISPYDRLFKKYAALIGWDWRMLAAIAFQESGFDPEKIAWSGASGLMQLMPRTASNFGLNGRTILNPEMNIEAGVQYIKSLDMLYRSIGDKHERIKFILASYNSGPAHVLDAVALAAKYGKNSEKWFDNTEYYLLRKAEPQYYRDPVVKYGYCRGKETAQYVKKTLNTYEKYVRKKK